MASIRRFYSVLAVIFTICTAVTQVTSQENCDGMCHGNIFDSCRNDSACFAISRVSNLLQGACVVPRLDYKLFCTQVCVLVLVSALVGLLCLCLVVYT